MKRQIMPFTTEENWLYERKNDLTSTDIACLFGVGRMSIDELKEHKRNKTSEQYIKNEDIEWGLALQSSIANKICKDNQWNYREMKEYIRIPELRIGSSFDYEISWESDLNGEAFLQKALLEIKNVNNFIYKKEWLEGFQIEAPPRIELQVQHQMLVSGHDLAYIGALIGGSKGITLRREANKKIQEAILNKCKKFWETIND